MYRKIETTKEGVEFVIHGVQQLPAVPVGTALIVRTEHAESCRYLARGRIVTATKYDADIHRQILGD